MVANERQVGGEHYKTNPGIVEHWDIVAQHGLDYFQGQITKYVMRWRFKGGVQDLEKARHFLDKYIELQKPQEDMCSDAVGGLAKGPLDRAAGLQHTSTQYRKG